MGYYLGYYMGYCVGYYMGYGGPVGVSGWRGRCAPGRLYGSPVAASRCALGADGVGAARPSAYITWEQAAGETVRTARSARGNTGTWAGPNGESGELSAVSQLSTTH